MKKIIISGFLLTGSIFFSVHAQIVSAGPGSKQFYLRAHVLQNIGFGSGLGQNRVYFSNSDGYYNSSTNRYGSFGNGTGGGLGAGYFFNDYMGLELNASIQTVKVSDQTLEQSGLPTSRISNSGFQIKLSPVIVFKAPIGKVAPYAKFGMVLPLLTKYTEVNDFGVYSGVSEVTPGPRHVEGVISCVIAPGITASLGAYVNIGKNMSLFGEIILTSLSQNKSTYSEKVYTVNGVDNLSKLTTAEKEIEYTSSYKDSYTFVDAGNGTGYYEIDGGYNPGKPSQRLTQAIPFTNIGLQIGVIYCFGNN